jgi:hypothetical protein
MCVVELKAEKAQIGQVGAGAKVKPELVEQGGGGKLLTRYGGFRQS